MRVIGVIEQLFLKWWSFYPSMIDKTWGRPISLEHIQGDARLRKVTKVPLLSEALSNGCICHDSSSPDIRVPAGNSLSLLDRHLLSELKVETLRLFHSALRNSNHFFSLTFDTGRAVSGSLADLCSLRLAGIIKSKPSPVFFDENYPIDSGETHPEGQMICCNAWLPTFQGLQIRTRFLESTEPLKIPLFLYFLSGNYVPEGHGLAHPVDIGPIDWMNAAHPSAIDFTSEAGGSGKPKRRGRGARPTPEAIRLLLLGLIFTTRKFSDTPVRIPASVTLRVNNLALPWAGNTFLSRHDSLLFESKEVAPDPRKVEM